MPRITFPLFETQFVANRNEFAKKNEATSVKYVRSVIFAFILTQYHYSTMPKLKKEGEK